MVAQGGVQCFADCVPWSAEKRLGLQALNSMHFRVSGTHPQTCITLSPHCFVDDFVRNNFVDYG